MARHLFQQPSRKGLLRCHLQTLFFFLDSNGQNSNPLVNPFSVGMGAAMAATLLVSSAHAVDVDGVITVDNAYGFAFGDVNGITTSSYYGGFQHDCRRSPMAPGVVLGPTGPGFTNPGVGPELYDLPSLATRLHVLDRLVGRQFVSRGDRIVHHWFHFGGHFAQHGVGSICHGHRS